MVRFSASSRDTCGSHLSSAPARLISGLRTFGSSVGSGWNRISLGEPVSFSTNLAISKTVSSRGFPILTGSWMLGSSERSGLSVEILFIFALFDGLVGISGQQCNDASHKVIDIAKASRLLSLAEDAEWLVLKGLDDEV